MVKKIYFNSKKHSKYYILVDDEDFEYLNQFKWTHRKGRNTSYAYRHKSGNTALEPKIAMHREILNFPDKELQVDHINHNGLDNRKSNLRLVTNRENHLNMVNQENPGVSWHKRNKKWMSRIYVKGKRIHLGYFMDKEDAINKYNEAHKLVKMEQYDKIEDIIIRPETSSKYKGVSWKKSTKNWQSRITYKSKRIYLGNFPTEKEAYNAILKFKKEKGD